jgi:hypothetical protein
MAEVMSAHVSRSASETDQNGDPVNPPSQVGWQYALVNLTVTNEGLGTGSPAYFFQGPSLDPPGIGLVENTPGGTTSIVRGAPEQTCVAPPLDLNTPEPLDPNAPNQVAPGESETGNLCFEIGSLAGPVLKYARTVALRGYTGWQRGSLDQRGPAGRRRKPSAPGEL